MVIGGESLRKLEVMVVDVSLSLWLPVIPCDFSVLYTRPLLRWHLLRGHYLLEANASTKPLDLKKYELNELVFFIKLPT